MRCVHHLQLSIAFAVALSFAAPLRAQSPANDTVTVHGRVLDPSGKTVSGAKVMLVAYDSDSPLSQTRSAADATFSLSFHKSAFAESIASWDSALVAATSPGFGPGWSRLERTDPDGNLTLTLATDDVPIQGRILDLEGRPVEGVTVFVTSLQPKVVDLKKLNIDRSDPQAEPADYQSDLSARVFGPAMIALTGPDGRFRFTGLGRDRTVGMLAKGGGIALSSIQAVTRHVDTQTRDFQAYIKTTITTYGADFDYTAAPGRVVTGTVRDAVTHEPLAGVAIRTGLISMDTATDALGRYRIESFRKERFAQLTAAPNERQPYLPCDKDIPLAEGFGPVTVDFELHRGVVFTGKVTDTAGNPASLADVGYYPYISNEFAKSAPEFAKAQVPGRHAPARTRADGSYHLVGLPGPAIIAVRGGKTPFRHGVGAEQIKCPRTRFAFAAYATPSPTSHSALKDVDIPPGQDRVTLDFQCDPGATVHLHLTDPDGKPLSGALAFGQTPGKPMERLKSPDVDVIALGPGEQRTIHLLYKPLSVGRLLTVSPADAPEGSLTVKLQPVSTLTGRLIGKDGQPLGSAALAGFFITASSNATDAEGRFSLKILPGKPFTIRGIKGMVDFLTDAQNITVEPGTTKDLGDVHVK